MPKAIDLRLKGVKFEDALLKMLRTPPMPSPKSAKKSTAQKSKRAKK